MANPLLAAMNRGSMDNMISDKLGPLKPALSHIGLYMGIVVFTAAGAKVSVFFFIFRIDFTDFTSKVVKSLL